MNATPERAKNDESGAPMLSRIEARRKEWARAVEGRHEDDYKPDMPPLERDAYLVSILYEIGPTVAAGMGAGPITHGELRAWQDNIGIALQPWESRFLRRLSQEYVSEGRRAEKLGCEPPWKPEGAKPEPTAAQLALRNLAKG